MIATDDFLKKINFEQCDKCCFCPREIETICHLFLRCCATNVFWNDVKQFLIQKCHKSNVVLTDLDLIGLYKVATSTAIDLVLLFGRYHIYSSKLTIYCILFLHFSRAKGPKDVINHLHIVTPKKILIKARENECQISQEL